MRNKLGRFIKGNSAPKTAFKKGHIPHNKDKKGWTNKHTFKKGHHHSMKSKKKISDSHKGKQMREKNPNWRGGSYTKKDGYIFILNSMHPFADKRGYVRRSRLVMEKMIGRYLTRKEVVHHKGIKYPLGSIKNKQDDRPKNLQLFKNQSLHIKFHNKIKVHIL